MTPLNSTKMSLCCGVKCHLIYIFIAVAVVCQTLPSGKYRLRYHIRDAQAVIELTFWRRLTFETNRRSAYSQIRYECASNVIIIIIWEFMLCLYVEWSYVTVMCRLCVVGQHGVLCESHKWWGIVAVFEWNRITFRIIAILLRKRCHSSKHF